MIVVTGAAGFIGSALVWRLNTRGVRDILCVDTPLTAEGNANLAPLAYREYVAHDDFRARWMSGEWQGEIEAVYHLGACSSTTETNWDYLRANNIEYSQDLCSLALDQGARFVHASSAATYGDGSHGYSDAHASTPSLEPLNLYGRSKQEFDLWALELGVMDRIAAVKYFNVYGPNEWDKGDMRSMVCKGYEQIAASGKVRLFKSDRPEYADGGQKRDFVYVKDAVDMTLWLGAHPEANGIFNVVVGVAMKPRQCRIVGDILRHAELDGERPIHHRRWAAEELPPLDHHRLGDVVADHNLRAAGIIQGDDRGPVEILPHLSIAIPDHPFHRHQLQRANLCGVVGHQLVVHRDDLHRIFWQIQVHRRVAKQDILLVVAEGSEPAGFGRQHRLANVQELQRCGIAGEQLAEILPHQVLVVVDEHPARCCQHADCPAPFMQQELLPTGRIRGVVEPPEVAGDSRDKSEHGVVGQLWDQRILLQNRLVPPDVRVSVHHPIHHHRATVQIG